MFRSVNGEREPSSMRGPRAQVHLGIPIIRFFNRVWLHWTTIMSDFQSHQRAQERAFQDIPCVDTQISQDMSIAQWV